jgi:C4-dicarboxylate-specific signal transduction histidine kinase
LKLTTRAAGDAAEIRVRDNGTGIPRDISNKLFQPFAMLTRLACPALQAAGRET